MKIRCLDGYFFFEEQRAGEVSDFISLFELELVAKDRYFTFSELADLPDYSLAGAPLLNTVATKTYAGQPWEILRENEMVFAFEIGKLVPLVAIQTIAPVSKAGNYLFSPGLIQPGSLSTDGRRIVDFVAWFSKETMKFKYSEVTYV